MSSDKTGPRHEVRITGYDYNMASWTWEKARTVVESLNKIVDDVRADETIPEATRARILDHAHVAAHNATKLMAVGIGAEWHIDDAGVALRDADGFRHVDRLYRDR